MTSGREKPAITLRNSRQPRFRRWLTDVYLSTVTSYYSRCHVVYALAHCRESDLSLCLNNSDSVFIFFIVWQEDVVHVFPISEAFRHFYI